MLFIRRCSRLLEIPYVLGSILGEKYIFIFLSAFEKRINVSLLNGQNVLSIPESEAFQQSLLSLSEGIRISFLSTIDTEELSIALKGCHTDFIHKLKPSLSIDVFVDVCLFLNLDKRASIETIVCHQKKLIQSIQEWRMVDIHANNRDKSKTPVYL